MHYMLQKFRSIIDCVNWVDDAPDDNVCVSELTILLSDSKSSESSAMRLGKPMHCPVRRVVVLGINKSESWILSTFTLSFGRMHTP